MSPSYIMVLVIALQVGQLAATVFIGLFAWRVVARLRAENDSLACELMRREGPSTLTFD